MLRAIEHDQTVMSESNGNRVDDLFRQGLLQHRQGNLNAAKEMFRQVLESSPKHAGAWHSLGLIALQQNAISDAIFSFGQATVFCDSNAIYWNNYGVALLEVRRFEEAKNAFKKAVSLNQNYADAWSNLGRVQMVAKQDREAEASLQNAIHLKPQHKDALTHLANLYRHQRRHRECAETLQKLLPLHPQDDDVLTRHIAECYASAKMHDEAMEYLSQAIARQPQQSSLHYYLAVQLGESGGFQQSKASFRKAASLSGGKDVWHWKHLAYCPVYFDNTQQIDDYWHRLNAELDEAIAEDNVYDWRTLAYDGFIPSFHLPHHNRCCREVKEKFTRLFAKSFPFDRPESPFQAGKRDKIRIGFLVTPGQEGGFFRYTSGIIERFNAERFEIVLIYHDVSKPRFERWQGQPHIRHVVYDWNFADAVTTIRQSQCDAVYYWKAGADPWNFYLPMCRLAPIQFTSWGTHGTSGMEHLDYSLSWQLAEMEGAQEHYTEKLYLCDESPFYHQEPKMPQDCSREKFGLPQKGALYFCPHRLSKYHPDHDAYLKGILENDSEGHILLLMGDSPALAEKFKTRMRRNIGETLMKRMIFIGKQPPQRYHQFMSLTTVLLDSHIYSGGITSYDAFSYDVPCVTQAGPLLIQRYPLSSYRSMGIVDAPIATNRDEYIRHAVRLGTDTDYHRFLSDQIRSRKHALFEQRSAVTQFELFLENIVR